MTRAADLKHMLSNARHPGESFKRYKARRAGANEAVKRQLKGRMAHVSTQVAVIPDKLWTAEHDAQVLAGRLVAMGKTGAARLVRTKGISFVA